jgi:hypothetical protein
MNTENILNFQNIRRKRHVGAEIAQSVYLRVERQEQEYFPGHNVQIDSEAHSTSYSMVTEASAPGI